jgi:kinesin family protein 2/24
MIVRKKERADEEQRNLAAGNPGDVDFIGMVSKWRADHAKQARPYQVENPRICVCVRKRPINDKELSKLDHDSVTCLNPAVWIHSAKLRVDGITKYLDHTAFHFDHAFDENVPTAEVYQHTAMPLLDFVCSGVGGRATVFAYGQTGSGKVRYEPAHIAALHILVSLTTH